LNYPLNPLIKLKVRSSNRETTQAQVIKHFLPALILSALITVFLFCTGCGATTAVKTTIKPPSTGTLSNTKPTISSSEPATAIIPNKVTSTTTSTTPTLVQNTFPLLITSPQTYAEYTLPIYLKADDTIHLVWTVSGVGEHIRMSINTPDGKYVGVKVTGGFIALTGDNPCDQLNRSGSIVLTPSDQKWVDGYYVFHPYIIDKDPTVNVKILYWIDH
jgi:hypothetical protein